MPSTPDKNPHRHRTQHPEISARWLIKAVAFALIAAIALGWLTLCLLFWQGSWQLLYHPASPIAHTPTEIGLPYDSIDFDTNQNGETLLRGWWIPFSPASRFTYVYLHGANGNMGDIVHDLIPLRATSMNIFAFDYRGYGKSKWARPSEVHLREDAESALHYLEDTRHIPGGSLILVGEGLGANLAVEVAAAHPEIAGVIVDRPLDSPVNMIFRDPRASLVPAHLLVKDRYDTDQAAAALRVDSLWYYDAPLNLPGRVFDEPQSFQKASGSKMLAWLPRQEDPPTAEVNALKSWLGDLSNKTAKQ
jgi:hypothetical protein